MNPHWPLDPQGYSSHFTLSPSPHYIKPNNSTIYKITNLPLHTRREELHLRLAHIPFAFYINSLQTVSPSSFQNATFNSSSSSSILAVSNSPISIGKFYLSFFFNYLFLERSWIQLLYTSRFKLKIVVLIFFFWLFYILNGSVFHFLLNF